MSSFEATLEKEKKQLMRIDALKGKVDVYKQVQDGMGQMAKLIEHGSTLPLLLSFEDLCATKHKHHLQLQGWLFKQSFGVIANRSLKIVNKLANTKECTCLAINLKGTDITNESIKPIARMKTIVEINISNTVLHDAGLMTIRKHLPLLESLAMNKCSHITADAIIATWEGCTRLYKLSAQYCPGINDTVLGKLATLPRKGNYQLQYLEVSYCRSLTSGGVLAISESQIAKVSHFGFSGCGQISSMAFFGFGTSTSLFNLHTMEMSKIKVDSSGISWIAEGVPNLKLLNMAECSGVDDIALGMLGNCKKLEEFYINDCPLISDHGIHLFLENSQNSDDESALRKLGLKSCILLTNKGIFNIAKTCNNLNYVDLRGLPRINDEAIVLLAKCCMDMKAIRLSGCGNIKFFGQPQVTDEGLIPFGKICRLAEYVDVAGCTSISDRSMIGIATNCTQMLELNLSGTRITDATVITLTLHCPQIKILNISKNKFITASSIQSIASELRNLNSLFIQYTQLKDEAFEYLGMYRSPLQVINFSGNECITDIGLLALCNGCTNLCEIVAKGCPLLMRNGLENALEKTPYCMPSQTPHFGGKPMPKVWINTAKQCLKMYQAVIVLQFNFQRWGQRRDIIQALHHRKHLRHTRAARKIQKLARVFISWKFFLKFLASGQNVTNVILIQAVTRGNQCRKIILPIMKKKLNAIIIIQHAFRLHFDFRIRNAIDIQRVVRGYLATLQANELRYERNCAMSARLVKWRRKYNHIQALKKRSCCIFAKAIKIQRQARAFLTLIRLRTYMRFYNRNAAKIQSLIRMDQQRKRFIIMRSVMNSAAKTIQRCYSMYRNVYIYHRYRKKVLRACRMLQNWSKTIHCRRKYKRHRATILQMQSNFKISRRRRRYGLLIQNTLAKQRRDAAITLQKHFRGKLGRRRALLFRKIVGAEGLTKSYNLRHYIVNRRLLRLGAALKIQRTYEKFRTKKWMHKTRDHHRAMAARQLQGRLRLWVNAIRKDNANRQINFAATQIQRAFRGYSGRKTYYVTYIAYNRLLGAIMAQKLVRGYLGRLQAKLKFQTFTTSATYIQRVYRGRHGRRIYNLMAARSLLRRKDIYLKSVKGAMENSVVSFEDRYRRECLRRRIQLLESTKAEWTRRTELVEKAILPIHTGHKHAWEDTDSVIRENYRNYRRLIGVTENVYASHYELQQDTQHNIDLKAELSKLQYQIMAFKHVVRTAMKQKRVLDADEFWQCAAETKLFEQVLH